MRSFLILGTALMLGAPAAPALAAVSDFRLPPPPSENQPPPDQQGPVAPDVPESRSAPAPSPTARAPAPAPTATPPIIIPPRLETSPPATATPAPAPAPRATATPATPPPASEAPTDITPSPVPEGAEAAPSPLPTFSPSAPSAPTGETAEGAGGTWWPWLLGALVLAALGAGAVVWRRNQAGPAAKVPEIERPRVVPAPAPAAELQAAAPPAPAASAPAEPLQVALEPLRMSLTLMNAALAYRLQVTNRGSTPLTGLSIGADMIAAHASMSREQQLGGPANGAKAERIERLEPGESRVIQGEFRVPFSQIVPIRQGNAALLLPLARFRVEAEGAPPVVRTFAVGQPGNGALQPFRLDQGPRIYPNLIQRAFA